MLNTYRHSSGLGVLVSGPGALVSGPVAWKSVRQRPGSDRQRSVAPGISFDRYSPDLTPRASWTHKLRAQGVGWSSGIPQGASVNDPRESVVWLPWTWPRNWAA